MVIERPRQRGLTSLTRFPPVRQPRVYSFSLSLGGATSTCRAIEQRMAAVVISLGTIESSIESNERESRERKRWLMRTGVLWWRPLEVERSLSGVDVASPPCWDYPRSSVDPRLSPHPPLPLRQRMTKDGSGNECKYARFAHSPRGWTRDLIVFSFSFYSPK